MARIVWAPEATQRLIDIEAYMRAQAPGQADPLVDRLIVAIERLAEFPRMGRLLPDAHRSSAREVIVDDFHIVYDTDGETVEIATILHGAMDVGTRLAELLGDDD